MQRSDESQTRLTWYTFGCASFAATGSLLYGIDSGIISTTIAQPTFPKYFAPYTADIAGAVVSTYAAGSFIGVLFSGWSADAWGRKRTIQFAAFWAAVAGIIQAASVHVGMLIAGRIIGGFAVGIMNTVIPIYNSEIAPPSKRGLVSGLHGQFVGFGFASANWLGFACSYAKGDFQWRFPLAVQTLPALILLAMGWMLPFSPRWLLEQGRDSEALEVMKKLNGGQLPDDFQEMKEQILWENDHSAKSWSQVFETKSNRRRLLLVVLVQVFTTLSGIDVINYQTILYDGVGIRGHTITLLAGIYGIIGPIANMVCVAYIDKWGRKKTMWITGIAMGCNMGVIMALTAKYATSNNVVGQSFIIAFIFLFSVIYSLGYNTIHFIYVPEIMNQAIRARGSALAVCANVGTGIFLNQISPRAFASVGYKYYALFACSNIFGAIVVYFFFIETKGRSLEEINELFGDEVVASCGDLPEPKPEDKEVSISKLD